MTKNTKNPDASEEPQRVDIEKALKAAALYVAEPELYATNLAKIAKQCGCSKAELKREVETLTQAEPAVSEEALKSALEFFGIEKQVHQIPADMPDVLKADNSPQEQFSKALEHDKGSEYITADDLSRRIRSGWRVKDMIPKKGLCVVWGPPGSGKSFFVLDLACAVARGLSDYHGKRIRPGVVVYLAMEGNLQDRVEAYKLTNKLGEGALSNLLVKHRTVNFMDPEAVLAECAYIKDAVGDREVAMIVVDTLARSMPGGNENGSEAMGAIIGGYKVIEDVFQTAVVPLHHCGKNIDNGMRGHSSLLGAIDAEIEIKRAGDDPVRTLHVGKQKDGQDHYDLFNFKLPRVVLGLTSRWDPDASPDEEDSSCVLQVTDEEAAGSKIERTTKNGNLMQRAIDNVMATKGDIRQEDVRAEFYRLHIGTQKTKEKAFSRGWLAFMNKTSEMPNVV